MLNEYEYTNKSSCLEQNTHTNKNTKNKNLELGTVRRLTGAGGSTAVCPGTDVENRRNPEKKNGYEYI